MARHRTTRGKERHINFGAWMPFTVIFLVVMGVAYWHLFTHSVPYMPKWAWGLLIFFGFPFGAVIYIAVVMFGAGTPRSDAEGRTLDG